MDDESMYTAYGIIILVWEEVGSKLLKVKNWSSTYLHIYILLFDMVLSTLRGAMELHQAFSIKRLSDATVLDRTFESLIGFIQTCL